LGSSGDYCAEGYFVVGFAGEKFDAYGGSAGGASFSSRHIYLVGRLLLHG
jgi:hypothetical protein